MLLSQVEHLAMFDHAEVGIQKLILEEGRHKGIPSAGKIKRTEVRRGGVGWRLEVEL